MSGGTGGNSYRSTGGAGGSFTAANGRTYQLNYKAALDRDGLGNDVTLTDVTGTTPAPTVTSPANGASTSSRVISGTGMIGDTIALTIDGAAVTTSGPITVGADGRWSYGAAGLADGQHIVTATQTQPGDGPSASSARGTFVLKTGAPTGLAQAGTATNGGTIEVTGTGDAAGDTVRFYNGTLLVGSGVAGANGAFDIVTSATFADATYAITATNTSPDGTQTSVQCRIRWARRPAVIRPAWQPRDGLLFFYRPCHHEASGWQDQNLARLAK